MKPLMIYCYDAYCGWCYGFSPVIAQFASENKERFDFEVLSGGMILPTKPVHISSMAAYIRQAYKTVESRTGVTFGEDYLWHVMNEEESDWYPDSLKPAIAMSIFKEYKPVLQVEFAADLQKAHHFEGRDLTDDEAYRHLLLQYGIPENEFYSKLRDPKYEESARYEFNLVKQLQVSGFPTVLMQEAEGRFYIISRGYADLGTFEASADRAVHSMTKDSSS